MRDVLNTAGPRRTSLSVALPLAAWHERPDVEQQKLAVTALEDGDVLVLPDLAFVLSASEKELLRPDCVKSGTKTIKYDPATRRLWGMSAEADQASLKSMLGRYADAASGLVEALIPGYVKGLKRGNTSFRPVETEGRSQSRRQDDRLLHVDAFPSRPTHGTRILRVFTNIHPGDKPRIWRVGEPFEAVARRFLPKIAPPLPGSAKLLHMLKLTKALRSPVDHYMLKLHDHMKFDATYQREAPQQTIAFGPGSTWMVFTDQVSHAAMSGQHALEQTFTLDISAMARPEQAPLRVLERLKAKPLNFH